MPSVSRFIRHGAIAAVALGVAGTPAQAQLPTIEKVVEIGCDDCTGPTQFSAIFDAAVTDSGDIVIADRSAPMIRVFDRTGKVLWTTGRNGQGPGELVFPMRIAIGPDRGVTVLDMRQARQTRYGRDGSLAGTSTYLGFLSASAVRGRTGEVVMVIDDFSGPLAIQRWPTGATKPVAHLTVPRRQSPSGGFVQPSIAVSASGTLALLLDPFTYRISRFAADGRAMPDVVRDIPPVRRTDAEMKELAARLASGPGRRAAEAGSSVAAGAPPGRDLSLKAHVGLDGLRFDDSGRLWALTMRGSGERSVFDVFSPDGAFIGSVTLPARVSTFSLAGPYLVAGGEDADGIPRVTLWRVRG